METILDGEMAGNESDIGIILPASAANISPCVFNATMFHTYIKGILLCILEVFYHTFRSEYYLEYDQTHNFK